MILSYADKRTRAFARGENVRAFESVAFRAQAKLEMLEAATTLGDLAALPGNRLESLKGNRAGQYSIRINDRWRVCFRWPEEDAGPSQVQIVDYH